MSICTNCGKMQGINNGYVVNGEFYCSDCATQCTDCGDVIILDDNYHYTTVDGNIICESCYNDNYYTCECCGEVLPYDIVIEIQRQRGYSEYICSACADNADKYYQCDECGKWFAYADDYLSDDYNSYCYTCRDNYYYCNDCGCLIHYDDVYFIEDEPYCECCFNDEKNKFIKPYSYTPELQYKQTKTDAILNNINSVLYYGLELEVAGNPELAESFVSYFEDDENEIYLTSDSSIEPEGFEITTQPMTFDYLQNILKPKLENALNYLKENDFRGHNAGGLHIHISKKVLTTYQRYILPLLIYTGSTESLAFKLLLAITQRKTKNLTHWASPISVLSYYPSKFFSYIDKYNKTSETRYTALNYTYSTIEFRIFNSSLRIERIFKNIEFVKACVDYSAYLEKKFICHNTIDNELFLRANIFNLLKYIIENAAFYPTLYAFLEEKHLITMLNVQNQSTEVLI